MRRNPIVLARRLREPTVRALHMRAQNITLKK